MWLNIVTCFFSNHYNLSTIGTFEGDVPVVILERPNVVSVVQIQLGAVTTLPDVRVIREHVTVHAWRQRYVQLPAVPMRYRATGVTCLSSALN